MKRALLLLDLQIDFLDPKGRLPIPSEQVGPMLSAARAAVEVAGRNQDPVINVGNEFRNIDVVENLLRRFAAMRGADGARWDPRAPRGGTGYFSKSTGNAFSNLGLKAFLEALKVTHLVLAGVYASECILKTARGGLAHGYQVQILAPAVGDASPPTVLGALQKLEAMGAQIVTGY